MLLRRGVIICTAACVLLCTGGTAIAQATPYIYIEPTSGPIYDGNWVGHAMPQTMDITNDGPGNATITGISLSGPGAADFSLGNYCINGLIGETQTCPPLVTFTPTAVGTVSAVLTVTTDSTPPVSLALT